MSEIILTLPELHARQQEIVDNAARFNVLNCGRRFGKNILLHDRVVTALLDGHLVGWGSPTYKNLGDDWRTLVGILGQIVSGKSEQDHRVEVVTGGVLEMWSLDNPTAIRGRKYHRFIINEAAHAPYLMETWNKVIRATLADYRGDGWFSSTPKGMNDWHTMYSTGLGGNDWRAWTFSSYDNPYIDPAELDSIRASTPDAEFRQEYLAEFVQNEGAVFRNLEAALTAPDRQTPEQHAGHTFVAGVDWGRDSDFTVISVGCVECAREIAIDRFNQIDYYFQRQRIAALHEAWKLRRLLVELNSIGAPNFEMLQRDGLPVTGFTTTQTSKTALIEAFSLALETGRVKLLNDEAGRSELQAYERTTTANGGSRYSAPAGMHDDTVIARALMYRAMSETRPGVGTTVKMQRLRQDYQGLREVFG